MSTNNVERVESFFTKRPELGLIAVYLFGARSASRRWDSVPAVAILADPERYPDPGRRGALLDRIAAELAAEHGDTGFRLGMLNDAPPLVARHIVNEGRRVVCFEPALERTHVRDVLVRAADFRAYLRRPRRTRLEAVPR